MKDGLCHIVDSTSWLKVNGNYLVEINEPEIIYCKNLMCY